MGQSLSLAARSNSEEIYTVSQLNRGAKQLLWERFPSIWVEGEISNFARPSSGHIYFTLKDETAQIRCAMFRARRLGLNFKPENGNQVLVKAQVSLYESRGDYQLIVDHMEEAGDGALRRAFDALKNRLSKNGLFDPNQKKPLPLLPRKIGVITSPTGAAIRDILTVLERRFTAIPIVIYPVSVQGDNAAGDIVKAIEIASLRNECDILILARGGGTLEDLWAFNEEAIALAMFNCSIPIITGIGHEIDFTIADFVADKRAATPSAAAETVTPDQKEWSDQIVQIERRLNQRIASTFQHRKQKLDWLYKRLDQQGPIKRLQDQNQRLDQLELRITRSISGYLTRSSTLLGTLAAKLHQHNPRNRINVLLSHHKHLSQRLQKAFENQLENRRLKLAELSHTLDTVSPLATLSRGYSIMVRDSDKTVIRSHKQIKPGERFQAKLALGHLNCTVEESLSE